MHHRSHVCVQESTVTTVTSITGRSLSWSGDPAPVAASTVIVCCCAGYHRVKSGCSHARGGRCRPFAPVAGPDRRSAARERGLGPNLHAKPGRYIAICYNLPEFSSCNFGPKPSSPGRWSRSREIFRADGGWRWLFLGQHDHLGPARRARSHLRLTRPQRARNRPLGNDPQIITPSGTHDLN